MKTEIGGERRGSGPSGDTGTVIGGTAAGDED